MDTSGLYAISCETDEKHHLGERLLKQLISDRENEFFTTNYVLLECLSLIQRRIGINIAETFGEYVNENLTLLWINEERHQSAWRLWKKRKKADLSLVDCASFLVMKEFGIENAFAFDEHFAEEGFVLLTEK